MTEPSLTVVVPSVNGLGDLMDCLAALSKQRSDVDLEVLVADRCGDPLRAEVRRAHPWVRLLEAAPETTIPDLRALAFREATGRSVAVIEDHVIVPTDGRALLDAQGGAQVVVGGAIENAAVDRLVDWAAFLCEYSHCITPLPEGPLTGCLETMSSIPASCSGATRQSLDGASGRIDCTTPCVATVYLVCRPQIAVATRSITPCGNTSRSDISTRGPTPGRASPTRRYRRGWATVPRRSRCAAASVPHRKRVVAKRRHRAELVRSLPLLGVFVVQGVGGDGRLRRRARRFIGEGLLTCVSC
jgi:hypothetical protein